MSEKKNPPKKLRRIHGEPEFKGIPEPMSIRGKPNTRRFREFEFLQTIEGIDTPVKLRIPMSPEIEIEVPKHDSPEVGERDSREASKILSGMKNVIVPLEHHYIGERQYKKATVEIDGEALGEVLENLVDGKPTKFTFEDTKHAVDIIQEALKKLHREGVYHGDISNRSNLILAKNPKNELMLGIIDWGYVKGKSQKGDLNGLKLLQEKVVAIMMMHSIKDTLNEIKERKKNGILEGSH